MLTPEHMADHAARWLVAVDILRRLDESFRLSNWAPMEGNYDCLLIHAEPLDGQPAIALNEFGKLVVLHGESAEVIADNPWPEVASSTRSVGELAADARLSLSRWSDAGVTVADSDRRLYGVLAEIARLSALRGLSLTVASARDWHQAGLEAVQPTSSTPEHQSVSPDLAGFPDLDEAVAGHPAAAADIWFVRDGEGRALGVLDRELILYRPGAAPIPLGRDPHVVDLGAAVVDHLTGSVATNVQALGLPAALAAFDRKERSLLFGAATGAVGGSEVHGFALRLDGSWAASLSAALERDVPSWAWAGFDYHLSWIAGAVAWTAGRAWPGQQAQFPARLVGDGEIVGGNQEDVDLAIAWSEGGRFQLVWVEAKGHTSWSTHQMTSKLNRLRAIDTFARSVGLPVDIRVVLVSPQPPSKLVLSAWPEFTRPDGTAYWMALPKRRFRVATERVDVAGHKTDSGTQWRIRSA